MLWTASQVTVQKRKMYKRYMVMNHTELGYSFVFNNFALLSALGKSVN